MEATDFARNKNNSPRLSILPARDDYRMNDPAGKAVLAPTRRRGTMKYTCLRYIEPGKFDGMPEDERHATFDECLECNDHLRANGHVVAGNGVKNDHLALGSAGVMLMLGREVKKCHSFAI
jgi:hypothetical protein